MNSLCANHECLLALIDERLSVEEQERLSEHIESCEVCQHQLEELTTVEDSGVFGLLYVTSPFQQMGVATNFSHPGHRLFRNLMHQLDRSQSQLSEATELPENFKVGEYRILKTIGQGGMGTVYLAQHARLDRKVAIKILPDRGHGDSNRVARFQREARAIGRLTHPNIVAAYDAGEAAGCHFLAMEYVSGVDLVQLVAKSGYLPPADACEIIRQAATGLQHIFQAGLIHRDLKPSNIMLTWIAGESVVKILDLGLANFVGPDRQLDSLTCSGQIMGTIDYMAPEQFGGQQVDIRADIFSLGATLYGLLSGTSPFAFGEQNVLEKLRQRSTQPIQPLLERRPDLPLELTRFIHQMLQPDVADRPSTPQEVAEVMQDFAFNHQLDKLNLTPPNNGLHDTLSLGSQIQTSPEWVFPNRSLNLESNRTHKRAGAAPRFWPRWIVVLAAGFLMLLASVIVLYQTDGGRITVTSSDPDLMIEVVRNATDVREFEVQQLAEQTWFRSGEYEIRLPRELDDKFTMQGNRFTLLRGDTKTVTIEVSPPTKVHVPIEADASHYYTFESMQRPGHVIEVQGGQADKNASFQYASIQLGEKSGGDHQMFRFIPEDNNYYIIESKLRPNAGIDIADWGISDQSNIQLQFRGPITTSAAKFKLVECGDGCVHLISGYDDNLRVGVADDNQNIVARRNVRGDRTEFRMRRMESIPAAEKSVEESTTEVKLSFSNHSDATIDVFWIDFQGFERMRAMLRSNDTWSSRTNHGHVWVLRDDGKQVGLVRVSEDENQVYEIEGQHPDIRMKSRE